MLDIKQVFITTITLHVTSGFYVRQFCRDMSTYIGTPGVVVEIDRISIEDKLHQNI